MNELAISILVITVRTVLPFTILRWPLGGVVLCMIADGLDWKLFELFGFGLFGNGHYQQLDKLLDLWYLFFAFIIVHRWSDALARRTGKILFLWRFVGFAIFEITHVRWLLVLAPNIFEFFYLFWTITLKWFSRFQLTPKRLAVILLVIGLPKIWQEMIMHWLYPGLGLWAPFR